MLGVDSLWRHGAKIDCQKQRVTLNGKKERKDVFLGETMVARKAL